MDQGADYLLRRLGEAQRILVAAQEVRDEWLAKVLEAGCNAEQAARAARLTPQAVRGWRQRRKLPAARAKGSGSGP